MTDASEPCPRCGSRELRDLTPIRRGLGWALVTSGGLGLLLAALWAGPAPTLLVVGAALFLALGAVAAHGAARARYCAGCRCRLPPLRPR